MRNPIASLTPADLRHWLRQFPDTARVGTAQSCTQCVLAAWFSAIFGKPVSVGETMVNGVIVAIIDPDGERRIWPLAQWQICLMMLVDDAADDTRTCAITAGAVLEILARMQRTEGVAA